MSDGPNQCNASLLCSCCHGLSCALQTATIGDASRQQPVGVSAQPSETKLDEEAAGQPPAVEDRVARAKRCLDQSIARVKKARIEVQSRTLQARFAEAQQQLDRANLQLMIAEETLEQAHPLNTDFRLANKKKMQERRQLALIHLVEAEEAILDNQEDE